MKRLCIIPARGGSKRIPRKNIKDFLGKPIIAYSIEAALASGLFTKVIVSTDDEEIAAVARAYGAEVPFLRSAENSDDHATTLDVLAEVAAFYRERAEDYPECCCIYATAPLVTAALLKTAYERFSEAVFDSVFPVLRFGFPIQRAVALDADHRLRMFQPEHLSARSQDLEPAYHDCGMFYWYRPVACLAAGRLWTDNSGCIVIGELEAHDIDTPQDWAVAEFKYRLQHGSHAG